jgi:hypothetical protein
MEREQMSRDGAIDPIALTTHRGSIVQTRHHDDMSLQPALMRATFIQSPIQD